MNKKKYWGGGGKTFCNEIINLIEKWFKKGKTK
jgi:hypothetical protein